MVCPANMMHGLFVLMTNLQLKQGQSVEVKGFIPQDAKYFAVTMGKDASNLALFFGARFESHGDINKIILNSRQANSWGAEVKEDSFPFWQGAETTVCFTFYGYKITTCLPSGEQITFPLRFEMDKISYVSMESFHLKSFTVRNTCACV
ncbi:galectin-1-like [Hyperolius riggenbachi]|uniref:galectin-1-like n=1 Tax=Hyperolius riggenbachi TaxID=752182 RepID=UPI0035A3953A